MEKIKSILSGIGIAILVIIGIFVFIKFSTVTLKTSPESPMTYAVYGDDGRSIKIILLPDYEMIMWYEDATEGFNEFTLTEIKRSEYGAHIFWRLWSLGNFEDGNALFGLRIYPSDIEPVYMEFETIEKYIEGKGESTYPKIGDTHNTIFLFGDDTIKFEGMLFQKEETNKEFILDLLEKLE